MLRLRDRSEQQCENEGRWDEAKVCVHDGIVNRGVDSRVKVPLSLANEGQPEDRRGRATRRRDTGHDSILRAARSDTASFKDSSGLPPVWRRCCRSTRGDPKRAAVRVFAKRACRFHAHPRERRSAMRPSARRRAANTRGGRSTDRRVGALASRDAAHVERMGSEIGGDASQPTGAPPRTVDRWDRRPSPATDDPASGAAYRMTGMPALPQSESSAATLRSRRRLQPAWLCSWTLTRERTVTSRVELRRPSPS